MTTRLIPTIAIVLLIIAAEIILIMYGWLTPLEKAGLTITLAFASIMFIYSWSGRKMAQRIAFTIIFIISVGLLASSCAEPAHSWQPTEPAFGADQAIAQNAFCGVIFGSLSRYAEDPQDKAVLLRLSKATADRIRQIGVSADDPAVTDGIRHAVAYAIGANDEQMVAAAQRCVEIVEIGERHK